MKNWTWKDMFPFFWICWLWRETFGYRGRQRRWASRNEFRARRSNRKSARHCGKRRSLGNDVATDILALFFLAPFVALYISAKVTKIQRKQRQTSTYTSYLDYPGLPKVFHRTAPTPPMPKKTNVLSSNTRPKSAATHYGTEVKLTSVRMNRKLASKTANPPKASSAISPQSPSGAWVSTDKESKTAQHFKSQEEIETQLAKDIEFMSKQAEEQKQATIQRAKHIREEKEKKTVARVDIVASLKAPITSRYTNDTNILKISERIEHADGNRGVFLGVFKVNYLVVDGTGVMIPVSVKGQGYSKTVDIQNLPEDIQGQLTAFYHQDGNIEGYTKPDWIDEENHTMWAALYLMI